MNRLRILAFLALGGIVTACASSGEHSYVTVEEQVRRDQSTGLHLAEGLEAKLRLKNDIEVSVYLREIAQSLSSATPELRDSPVGVLTFHQTDKRWRNFGIPGNRIYLCIELMQRIRYENVLASMIAFELAHLMHRHVLKRLDAVIGAPAEIPSQTRLAFPAQYIGPKGIFAFSSDDHLNSVETAVGVLYRAGYDPRGLVRLWTEYQGNPEHSPYDPDLLWKMIERTRQAIAQFAPLRNPVVRSASFLKIQKRIRSL